MLRGAIIGLGNVAVNGHLPGWEGCERARIVAAADALEPRLVEARQRLPRAGLYTGVEALLASEPLDFLDICTPPGTHASLTLMALRRGLHVLCEKPLVLSPDELRLVRHAQAESGRVLHTVHNWLYAPIILKATDLIITGQIGTVRHIRWQVLRREPSVAVGLVLDSTEGAVPGNWRLDPTMAGGGILLDHGWHALYIILRWLGTDPKTIAASLEKRAHPEWPVEDTATVQLNFPEAVADIFLTWAASSRDNSAVIEGTRGVIRLEDGALILQSEGGEQRWTFEQPLSQGSHHPDWFSHVRNDFLREISDTERNGENLATASLCAQLLHLAKESHTGGGQHLAVSGQLKG
ncbi:Gfo/Idh/MocA family oxidoreductase [Candidatus Methylomirabilis sp.]|uniref:Gfo/Idh/MocA family protein n=1 Tax=Candidatus Methylomirabilis sp. TaxID=2032687 RepID=UPI002A5DCA67|nr:Gfo/Idh/MocA family oxidoreductase [Candidatus Methylomirabilis sp.]